jgi:hypothetical protein
MGAARMVPVREATRGRRKRSLNILGEVMARCTIEDEETTPGRLRMCLEKFEQKEYDGNGLS